MTAPFGRRLQAAVAANGPILAGVDPHAPLLEAWGLEDTPQGVREFSRRTLEAVDGQVAAIKPQSAFFERHGSAGIAVLEELLASARDRGILTILDVKRGDIGSTMGAYADAYLRPGAPLEADALTLSPYLGFGTLEPFLEHVRESGKGVFVLALTSNPEGREVQHAVAPGRPGVPSRGQDGNSVAATMVRHVHTVNSRVPTEDWGSVGLVIGATVGDAVRELDIDLETSRAPLLVPGFGAQGGGPSELTSVFGSSADRVLVSVSRGLLSAGGSPEALRERALALREEYAPGAAG